MVQVLDPLLLSGLSFLYRGVLVLITGKWYKCSTHCYCPDSRFYIGDSAVKISLAERTKSSTHCYCPDPRFYMKGGACEKLARLLRAGNLTFTDCHTSGLSTSRNAFDAPRAEAAHS